MSDDIRKLVRLHVDSIETTMLIAKVISDIAKIKRNINIINIKNVTIEELSNMQDELLEQEGLI